MSDRRDRRDDRRPARDDHRNHKPRYEQDRSRSPPRRDRRDDWRRDRSPPRGPSARNGPPGRSDRDRDLQRSRDNHGPAPPRGPRGGPDERLRREPADVKSNGMGPRGAPNAVIKEESKDVKMEQASEDEDSESEMQRIMGFRDFRTTKNTKVPGNDKNYAVHKVKKSEYRQYMNRVGGFNRPLDAM
ncbi:U4/U6.U5 Small nuclear ribonucleoprotein [Sphaerulina musiva]